MDFTTLYLGLKLKSPLVAAPSPLSEEIGNIRKLEDAGAGAVVMHSLFEEQIVRESLDLHRFSMKGTESFAESLTYFPEPSEYRVGPEEYLDHIRKAKESVRIPIIGSLNGTTVGGWTEYAARIQEAGADALELNIYYIPTDPALSAEHVESTYIDILKAVKSAVRIPVAVKLSPFFSNMAYTAHRLDQAGANGLVLFNRFYQPDIDLEELRVKSHVLLSTPQAMRLPLRWIAILHGRVGADLAATSGIHTSGDCLKMMMVGAKVAMLCAVLLKKGIDQLREIEKGMRQWMEEHEYESIEQMQGSMSQQKTGDPSAFERAQYMRALTTYVS
ncbi:MAG: dihydroorotate dehydrogenase-like protein [Candidatus Latescibacterota bacterium]|nr:MAG: dihydroorotate dehydrogenase-like protein [Candidatus Latescibacterota bacterium]